MSDRKSSARAGFAMSGWRLRVTLAVSVVAFACCAVAAPSNSATNDVRPKLGQYKGKTEQDLPMRFEVKRSRNGEHKVVTNVFVQLRFKCRSRPIWFPHDPNDDPNGGYGSFRVRDNGTFESQDGYPGTGTRGRFVTRIKAKGSFGGGFQCPNGNIAVKRVDFRAHKV